MANLHQAAAAGVQQAPIGDHPGADVMIDDHLNDVPGAARGAKQRFRHSPGADVMLNIDWHPGMIGQRFAERDIFNILIKRHAMNNAISVSIIPGIVMAMEVRRSSFFDGE